MRGKITEDQKKEILNLYKKGKTGVEISNLFNISSSSIYKILEKSKIKRRKSSFYKELNLPIDTIVKKYDKGKTVKELAKEYECNETSIRNLLNRNGIKLGRDKSKKIDDNFILKLYNNGLSITEISEKINLANNSIWARLIKNGIEIRGCKRQLDVNYILNEYSKGRSCRSLGKELNCGYNTIRKRLEENGVKIRRDLYSGTHIEFLVESFLKKQGINFKQQFRLFYSNFFYDFFLPDYNLFIECDGDYWHGNPEFYPKPNEMQLENQIRDQRKNALVNRLNLHTGENYKLLRFWEDDINNDFEFVEDKILKEIIT